MNNTYNESQNKFIANNHSVRGNFTMSINTWKTAFTDFGGANTENSKMYNDMMENRKIIARRLADSRIENSNAGYNPDEISEETKYPVGYGPTSQEVLLPAFIAAYTGKSPEKVSLSPLPSVKYMSPNWQINYNGDVTKIAGINNLAKSVALSHSYQSTYNIGNYQSNMYYNDAIYNDGFSYVTDANGNFVPNYDIASANITELFNPLFNLDVTWINNISTGVEFNRARSMTISFANNQIAEVLSREFSFGLGYRLPQLNLFIKTNNKQKSISNDLNIRADLAIRKNKTLLRQLNNDKEQLTAGQHVAILKTSLDYILNEIFQLRLYYDRTVNNPYTSNAFPTIMSSFGMTFRYTLKP